MINTTLQMFKIWIYDEVFHWYNALSRVVTYNRSRTRVFLICNYSAIPTNRFICNRIWCNRSIMPQKVHWTYFGFAWWVRYCGRIVAPYGMYVLGFDRWFWLCVPTRLSNNKHMWTEIGSVSMSASCKLQAVTKIIRLDELVQTTLCLQT